jgi:hypothetical protein
VKSSTPFVKAIDLFSHGPLLNKGATKPSDGTLWLNLGDTYTSRRHAVAESRRHVHPDGTLWLNLGDTYIGGRNGGIEYIKWKSAIRIARTYCGKNVSIS